MIFKQKTCYLIFLLTNRIDFIFMVMFRSMLVQCFLNQKIKNLIIRSDVYISGRRKLEIGNDVSINQGCFISAEGGLKIGNYVAIGHKTSILTTEHSYQAKDIPIKYQPIRYASVDIADNVWIGANVTILAGVNIAEGTIVAAGAVVTKSVIEKNTIIGGVPAKHLKGRFS